VEGIESIRIVQGLVRLNCVAIWNGVGDFGTLCSLRGK
jgi:hypothetical protein